MAGIDRSTKKVVGGHFMSYLNVIKKLKKVSTFII